MRKKVVIVGSGLGGLSCGVVLAKNGYDVTILEQGLQVGGCLQCFVRHGVKFETGMHFIGSAAQGQTLNKLLRFLGVTDAIELSALDTTGYDVVALNGEKYKFANGREAFLEQMGSYFPKQKDNLATYFSLVEKVASASTLHSLKTAESDAAINTEFQLRSINEVIDSVITDQKLADVLVGNLPLYAAEKDKTPFATHAFILDFYNQSSFRIVGGSDGVATVLVNQVEKLGGVVRTKSKVTKIVCNDTQAVGVEVNGEEFVAADIVISDTHPMRTLEMLDTKLIRQSFRNRIANIPQTVGTFSVYLDFKENTLPYMNSNFYGYNQSSPWNCEQYDEVSWPKGYLYMHFCHEKNPVFARGGVILSYMQMADVMPWIGTQVGRRGEDYKTFKKQKAEMLIDSVCKQFPELRNAIRNYHTSTPLTYVNYTGTEGGSMYGVAKDITMGAACRVPHRTRVPNVLQTGQNINSHGMLGVLVGTIVTCSELLSAEKIYKQIVEANE